jgi:Tfp pilus assembly protein PilX
MGVFQQPARSLKEEVTTQVDRLKVDRLKEKRCAITQSQDCLDTPACAAVAGRLASDCVMVDHYCPSFFSLQPSA